MADILLTHCNHLYYDRKQIQKMQPYPPLQTLLAASYLRQEGFSVALFDSTLAIPEEGFRSALKHHRPRVVAICEDNFNFLTKMCLSGNRELAVSLAGIAKEYDDIPVLVNGSDASDHPSEYLSKGIDVVMRGELELTLLELSRLLLRDPAGSLDDICGLVYPDGICEKYHYTAPRQPAKDLAGFPMPAWDLVDVDAYRDAWREAHGYFSLNMAASRGCPYHCNWCAKPIYGQTYRFVPPAQVAEEMKFVKRTFAPDQIWFADDIFALSSQWTGQFSEAVERARAQIPFKMQSRCDLMTRTTVAALKRAGCAEVWIGAESGSQNVLDAMEKGTRVEQIYQARESLRRHGVRTGFFLQFGYPGETWEDIQSTIRMVRDTVPDEVGISVSYPLPGTPFYHRVAAELGSKQNWSESGDLSMMFRGTYTSEFYTALHDALHLEVDLMNGRLDRRSGGEQLQDLWSKVENLEGVTL